MTDFQHHDAAVDTFVARYPATDVRPVTSDFLEYAQERLPEPLVELYRRYGLGWFGNQDLQLVDPARWLRVIQAWFGPSAATIPVAVTSFGHLFHVDAAGQVQCLDPHFLANTVVASDLDEFFGTYLLSETSHLADLRGPHQGAIAKLGSLDAGELYAFEPALPLGGTVTPDTLVKDDAVARALRTHAAIRQHRAA